MKRLIVAVLIGLFVVPATAHAVTLGFNDAFVHENKWDRAPQYAGESVPQMLNEAGASIIRVPWEWSVGEDPSHVIDAAHVNGIATILTPYSRTQDADRPAYYRLLRKLARTYPESPIEVLNEANNSVYGDYTATEYATVLRKAINAIRVIDPDHTILGASEEGIGVCGTGDRWIYRVASQTADLDYIASLHVYPGACSTATPGLWMNNAIDFAQGAFGSRPIWITEVGYSSPNETLQANVLAGLVSAAVNRGIPKILIHRLWDMPLSYYNGNLLSAYWGLHRSAAAGDGWKPAMDAVQQAVASTSIAMAKRGRISRHCHARIRHHNRHHHKRTRRERFLRCFKRLNS